MSWRTLVAAIVAVVSAGLCGVSCASAGAPVENDPEALAEQLDTIRNNGGQQRMRDVVPGDWTAVHVFDMESLIPESVEDEVGYSLDLPPSYLNTMGTVFVFVDDEGVVRAAAIDGVRFGYTASPGDSDSVVRFDTKTELFELA